MPDDLSKKGPPDALRINVHEAWELTGWSKHFGITEAVLKQAVAAAGSMTADVKAWLKKSGHIL